MTLRVDHFNTAAASGLHEDLLTCLRSPAWAATVLAGRPYPTDHALESMALAAARDLTDGELARALAAHPRIGERPVGAGAEADASRAEQAGVSRDDVTAAALREANLAYEERFGHVFLIRAAGRDAAEILAEARRRLGNDPRAESVEVREQLGQIAVLRLRGLLDRPAGPVTSPVTGPVTGPVTSAVTTHVLDTSTGTPATGVAVRLEAAVGDGWVQVALSRTDGDGRCRDLGPALLEPGGYRLVFGTAAWFARHGVRAFHPEVTVAFEVSGPGHLHVPLLVAPFGYSTYRGS